MDDLAITIELCAAMNLEPPRAELATLFGLAPELVEWSINSASDPRGALRVSTWTRERWLASAALEMLASEGTAIREMLVDAEEYEGLGLALRPGEPPTVRWWTFASDGHDLAARARIGWPAHVLAIDELLTTVGGAHACAAVGLEIAGGHQRETIYARLPDPAAALRVLELARVPVSRESNLFWKGLCGLEPHGRPWPKVWVGRSIGAHPGWKFYYFARGDELRRTDEVLLDAVAAGPELMASWHLLRAAIPEPPGLVQLIALTIADAQPPAFTTYLARS